MAQDFDREGFMQSLASAVEGRLQAAQLGEELGRKGYKRLYFVGCGAPNRLMAMMEYWAQRIAVNTEIRRYFPAEFVNQNPASLDKDTLVILGSRHHEETVEGGPLPAKTKPCTTVSYRKPALPGTGCGSLPPGGPRLATTPSTS